MNRRADWTARPCRTIALAAAWLDRTGFSLLMPHRGLPLPSLWEAIRGRAGGHPFREWDADAERMWAWKDEIPKRRLAFYGHVWAGRPGFVSRELLPLLLRLWGCPPGEDGFRAAYRDGALSFDANRLGESLLRSGPVSTYRLRVKVGLKPGSFKRALVELERRLIVARCGSDESETTWAAGVVDLSARVFPKAHAELRAVSSLEAREAVVAAMRVATPGLTPRQVARLLRLGAAALGA